MPRANLKAMRIANPMYYAAFKYLMDDQAAARLLVEAMLGEEVVSLQPLPDKRHLLDVNVREIPERYDPVLRRMEGAAASIEVTDSMALEDEVAETWGRMKREIAEKDAALAEMDAIIERQRTERAAEERIAGLERRLASSSRD